MKPYFIGMCANCPFMKDYSITFGSWFCDYYNKPMYIINNCTGPKEK